MAFKPFLIYLASFVASLYYLSAAEMIPNFKSQEGIGYRNIAYFVNWGIYDRNYQPSAIPVDQLTHILYAFANVRDTGEVYLTDPWADTDKHYPGDSWNDNGNNVYGCLRQLFLLKKKNRSLKTLLSIGGWTYSANFPTPTSSDEGRTKFAETAVTLMKDLGFDGIDIDWEYPADENQAHNLVALLKAIRGTLDAYTAQHGGSKILLTMASPAGPQHYNKLKLADMIAYLDFFNLMGYDYAGSFANATGHQANLYPSTDNPRSTPFSTDSTIRDYIKTGVPPDKINLGMPLYGHAFQQTDGMGKTFNGVGEGPFEKGIWDYKVLPQAGAVEQMDQQAGASYSWDGAKKIIVSYDTLAMSNAKVDYIKKNKLGGGMFWELSGDRKDSGSLITNVFRGLGPDEMDKSQNTLSYPQSKYDNVRAGMP